MTDITQQNSRIEYILVVLVNVQVQNVQIYKYTKQKLILENIHYKTSSGKATGDNSSDQPINTCVRIYIYMQIVRNASVF